MYKRVYDFPTPLINLTMTSLRAKESQQPQKHRKHKTQNKTKILNEYIYTQSNTLIQKNSLTNRQQDHTYTQS